MTPSAEQMANIVGSVGDILYRSSIIDDHAVSVFSRLRSDLNRQKGKASWSISVDRGQPITFSQCLDDKGESIIVPKIVSKGVVVRNTDGYPPFDALDIALEIEYEGGKPLTRWHIDKANEQADGFQDGPLFHVQMGGHHHNNRDEDLPIKRPRWNHPPLDIVLLCELVAANFFSEQWQELNKDPAWCDYISQCQKYCYTGYINKLQQALNTSSKTILGQFWANQP